MEIPTMACDRTLAQLDDFVDGTLGHEERLAFEAHLAACEPCRRRLEREHAVREALRSLPIEGPSPGFDERVIAAATTAADASPRRVPRILAAGLAALLLVGLIAIGVSNRPASIPPEHAVGLVRTIRVTPDQVRTVNLVFNSESALEGVSLVLELPMGVELRGYPGLARVRWTTNLSAGRNILPLNLNATVDATGELVARLRHGDKETVFRIPIANAG